MNQPQVGFCDVRLCGTVKRDLKLKELRSYLYANRERIMSYAESLRNKERASTAHAKSTVNQLINWRMCKKHLMA
jgi:hypothetical protein